MPQGAVQNIVGASINALLNHTGFTIHAESGKPYTGRWWLVGGIIPSLVLTDKQSAQEYHDQIEEWYKGARALDGEDALVGGWTVDDTIYLDLVSLVKDDEVARLLGKLWDQIAIGRFNDDDQYDELSLV